MTTRPFARVALTLSLILAAGQLGACAGKHGKYTQAAKEKSVQRVNELKSMNEYQMARQQYLAGDLSKALTSIDRAITLNPGVAKSHVLRGRINIELGDMENATASLKRAEEIDAQNVEAQYYLGIVAERVSMTEEAQQRYLNAARLDPTNAQYVVAAAEMMIDRGLLDEAEGFLAQQASLLANNAGIRQTRGHVAMLRGDTEAACRFFHEARLLAPDDTVILEDLIRAQIAVGKFADAEFHLATLLKSKGFEDRRDLQTMRARCLLNLDRPIEAREMFVKLTQGDAGARDADAWIELGNLSYLLRDDRRLRDAALRVVALAPERHEGYTFRGLYHRRRGELEQALLWFDQAVERRGAEVHPLVLRGLLLEQLGRFDDARSSYAAALLQNPDDPGIALLLEALPPATGAYATYPDGN